MFTVTYPNLAPLAEFVPNHDFFVVGELHGIEQNAHIIQILLDETLKYAPNISLAFEWLITASELASLRAFINGEIDMFETPAFFHNSDGRVTSSHITLLQHVRLLNRVHPNSVHIHTFDTESAVPEKAMAENLIRVRKESDGMPILVETGAIHAYKQTHSMVGILEDQYRLHNTFVKYETGRVAVEGELYDVQDSASQCNGPKEVFDSLIIVDLADPAQELIPLTISC